MISGVLRRWIALSAVPLLAFVLPGLARADPGWTRFDASHSLQFGESADIWTRGATALDIEYTTPDGATFFVEQNGKAFPPTYAGRTPSTETSTFRVAATDVPTRLRVQWDFPRT